MSLRKLALVLLAAAIVVFVAVAAAPLLLTAMVKIWARQAASAGLTTKFHRIEARPFRPIILEQIELISGASLLSAERVEVDLNYGALLHRNDHRLVRRLRIAGLRGRVEIGQVPQHETPAAWQALARLVPDSFDLQATDVSIRHRGATFAFRGVTVRASEMAAGVFSAAEVAFTAPFMQKAFRELRGATHWQDTRLTIAGLTLLRGLDVENLTFDLSRLNDEQIGVETTIDAFGGTLRATVLSSTKNDARQWDVAGTATEVSLGRISDALEFSTRASGSLHASKFTFQGNPAQAAAATASIWAEITGATWRDRTADVVMIGASLYEHQISIEQLYLTQRRNQLTVTGEIALPDQPNEWPDFRGDVSAQVGDLGDFARLLGADAADFAGELNVDGNAAQTGKELEGRFVATGREMKAFGQPLDSLGAQITLSSAAAHIDRLAVRRAEAALEFNGEAQIETGGALTIRLTTAAPVAVDPIGDCVSGFALSETPAQSQRPVIHRIELRRDAQEKTWSGTLAGENGAAAQPFRFCFDNADAPPLTIAAPPTR